MSLRDKLIRNFNTVELRTEDRKPLYDGNRSARLIGPRAQDCAARDLGATVDILMPGKVGCPYHFHYAEEEMFVILEGEGTLRVADERIPIKAGDVIDIPPGPEYPHHIINTSNAPLKYLSISTQKRLEICEYPDSNKYLASTSDPRGLVASRKMHRAGTDLDYWDGEP